LSYLFYSIWNFYWRAKNDALVRLCASFLIGIVVHATFEVSLTQTNLTAGVLEWMILALGVSKTCEVMRESEPTQERAESPEAFQLSRSARS
jgi:DNA integrity scanning protein DisA with diadenylate cyclase activity